MAQSSTTEASDLQKKLAKQGLAEQISSDLGNQRSDGKHNVKATCPFCGGNDFSYNTEDPFYHCWNCDQSGDWIDYLQEKEGLTFKQALNHLAQMGGVELNNVEVSDEYRKKQNRRELYEQVFEYTQDTLHHPEGERVLDYLKKERGYTEEEIEEMGLGACTDRNKLVEYLKDEGFDHELLSDCGIFTGSDLGFGITHKLIIPWKNRYGKASGIAGRVIDPDLEDDKYLFPSKFNKSAMFIGLDRARYSDELVLTEGLLDALYLNSHDFPAIGMGGAGDFSKTQEDILSKVDPDQLIVAYDDDTTGRKGTKKIVRQSQNSDYDTYVATFDSYKDPDELVRQEGPEQFEKALDEAERASNWLGKYVVKSNNLDTDRGVDKAIDQAVDASGGLEGVSKQDFDRAVSEALGDSADRYKEEVEKVREEKRRQKTQQTKDAALEKLEETDPDPEQLQQIFSDGLEDISKIQDQEIERYGFDEFIEDVKESDPGLKTGIETLDEEISIPQGALTVVAGRPGHGKTTFMLNLLRNMTAEYSNKRFAFFSYEESKDHLATKLLMAEAGEELGNGYKGGNNLEKYRSYIRGGKHQNVESIEEGLNKLERLMERRRLHLVSEPLDAQGLSSAIRGLAEEGGKDLGAVFVDYLQKIDYSGLSDERYLQIADATELLRREATDLRVPIICGAQFGRRAEHEEELKMSHIREAGDIEQDANLVIGLEKNRDILDLELLKNREGTTEELPSLDFQGSTLRIGASESNLY